MGPRQRELWKCVRNRLRPRVIEPRIIELVVGERKWSRDLRYLFGSQGRQTPSIESTGFVIKVWEYLVVGDLLKVVKKRASLVCFKDRRMCLVSNRGFAFCRRTFRATLGTSKAANDPGWQKARRGIHRRWYNEEKGAQRRLARSLAV